MTNLRTLGILHVALLILAATNFTVFSWFWGDASSSCDFYTLGYRNGHGYSYVSEYSLGQIICYILSYGLGVILFRSLWGNHHLGACFLGATFSFFGVISFTLEASHWLFNHHLSLIASFPIFVLLIWIFVIVRLQRSSTLQKAQQDAAPNC